MAATTCKVKYLVVDSAGFIKNAPIHEIAENVYTIEDVVGEIKDKATKQRLQVLPYNLNFKEPCQQSIKTINEYAKRTGDYESLSATDIRLLALTYMLHKEHIGTDSLKEVKDVRKVEMGLNSGKDQKADMIGFYNPDDQKESLAKDVEEEEEDEDDDDDDDAGWINPSNIQGKMKEHGVEETNATVACLSTDFAMQNVLKQIGLHVIGVDGMIIKNIRTYAMRCYSCRKITPKMSSVFCPKCGYKTMKRVSVSVGDDGEVQVHINFTKPLNTRGTRYSMPTPKGGNRANNPVVFEDQPMPQKRLTRRAKQAIDVFDPGFEALHSPFAIKDVNSKAFQRGFHLQTSRSNPNSNRKNKRKK